MTLSRATTVEFSTGYRRDFRRVSDVLRDGPEGAIVGLELAGGGYLRPLGRGWDLTLPRPVGPCGRVEDVVLTRENGDRVSL